LSLSLTPVAVGAAIAWAEAARPRWLPVVVAAAAACLIQAATNLYNDAADFRRGGDTSARVGPKRVTAAGLVSAAEVSRAALLCFLGAAAMGAYLAWVGGWPILVLGLAAIASGWAYSGGPAPISYSALGELFVLVFFGLAAVGGTYWLAASAVSLAALVAGGALGGFAAAVLLVNNHRDRDEDARVGRRTLAIALGVEATKWLYAALMLAPFVLLAPLSRLLPGSHVAAALICAPFALLVVARLFREPSGAGLNTTLAQTAQVQIGFALLLCLGIVM
jgi:1,4-dihydroxy-2-naphthoate polyprenyltransferase